MNKDSQRALKAKAHSLKPVVLMGHKGLTPAVITEIEAALQCHELIKIKLVGEDKAERQTLMTTICEQTHAEPIGLIGQIAIVYRKRKD